MFQTKRVAAIAAGHAAHDTYTAFLPPLIPLFIPLLLMSKTEAGLLAVFLQLPWLLQPFIGHVADRTRPHLFVVLAPAVSGVMMTLLGVAPSYGIMVIILLVAGFSSASIHAAAPALIAALSGKNIGRGMGIWMVGGELGRTVGPLVVVGAVHLLTLRGLPWLMIGGVIASLLLHLQLRLLSTTSARAEEVLPWQAVLRGMRTILLPLAGVMLARSFLAVALTLYLPLFLREEGAQLWLAGISLSVVEAAGVGGALAGGAVSDRIGRRATLAVSLSAAPVMLLVLLMTGGWLRYPVLMLAGFTGLSFGSVIMALVQDNFPGNRALANGTYMVLSFAARSSATVIMGALGDFLGLRTAFALAAVIGLLGLFLVVFLPGRSPAASG